MPSKPLNPLTDVELGYLWRYADTGRHNWTQPIQPLIARACSELRERREREQQIPIGYEEHGFTCHKAPHVGTGYLHGADDDRPYDVDGIMYCGRCHTVMP